MAAVVEVHDNLLANGLNEAADEAVSDRDLESPGDAFEPNPGNEAAEDEEGSMLPEFPRLSLLTFSPRYKLLKSSLIT